LARIVPRQIEVASFSLGQVGSLCDPTSQYWFVRSARGPHLAGPRRSASRV